MPIFICFSKYYEFLHESYSTIRNLQNPAPADFAVFFIKSQCIQDHSLLFINNFMLAQTDHAPLFPRARKGHRQRRKVK
jgi:hypothetical protein